MLLFDVLSRGRTQERSDAGGTSCFAGSGKKTGRRIARGARSLPRLQIFLDANLTRPTNVEVWKTREVEKRRCVLSRWWFNSAAAAGNCVTVFVSAGTATRGCNRDNTMIRTRGFENNGDNNFSRLACESNFRKRSTGSVEITAKTVLPSRNQRLAFYLAIGKTAITSDSAIPIGLKGPFFSSAFVLSFLFIRNFFSIRLIKRCTAKIVDSKFLFTLRLGWHVQQLAA